MCQGLIGKVKSAEVDRLVVEYKGRFISLRSNLKQVQQGDYVLFSSDIALDTIEKEEALAVLGESE